MSYEEETLRGRVIESIKKGDNYESRIASVLRKNNSSVYQALKALEEKGFIRKEKEVSNGPISSWGRRTYSLTPIGAKAVEIREYIRMHNLLFSELINKFLTDVLLINLMVEIFIIRRKADDSVAV